MSPLERPTYQTARRQAALMFALTYDKKRSLEQIAEDIGVKPSTISHWKRQWGWVRGKVVKPTRQLHSVRRPRK